MWQTAKRINTEIEQADRILLVCHKNPDGDTLGSITAFIHYLKKINKQPVGFCLTPIPEGFRYLPHVDDITNNTTIWENETYDLLIVFDSGDLSYAGVADLLPKLAKQPPIIDIDHHATNHLYGKHNLVITTASSTAEIVYQYFTYNKIDIDKHMATSLLTGLTTDTDHFTNAATSSSALRAASELIGLGGNFSRIKETTLKNKSIIGLKLWGIMFNRITKQEKHDIIYTYITQQDLLDCHAKETEVEDVSNFFNNLGEGKAALVLKEGRDGRIKGSFRTTRDDVDVSAYALALGGGGHKKAAGFSTDGPIEKAITTVFETIDAVDNKLQTTDNR